MRLHALNGAPKRVPHNLFRPQAPQHLPQGRIHDLQHWHMPSRRACMPLTLAAVKRPSGCHEDAFRLFA